jgi:hypothetical protein
MPLSDCMSYISVSQIWPCLPPGAHFGSCPGNPVLYHYGVSPTRPTVQERMYSFVCGRHARTIGSTIDSDDTITCAGRPIKEDVWAQWQTAFHPTMHSMIPRGWGWVRANEGVCVCVCVRVQACKRNPFSRESLWDQSHSQKLICSTTCDASGLVIHMLPLQEERGRREGKDRGKDEWEINTVMQYENYSE